MAFLATAFIASIEEVSSVSSLIAIDDDDDDDDMKDWRGGGADVIEGREEEGKSVSDPVAIKVLVGIGIVGAATSDPPIESKASNPSPSPEEEEEEEEPFTA